MARIKIFPIAHPESSKTKVIAAVKTGPRFYKARSGKVNLDKFLASHGSRKVTAFKRKWKKGDLVCLFVDTFLSSPNYPLLL